MYYVVFHVFCEFRSETRGTGARGAAAVDSRLERQTGNPASPRVQTGPGAGTELKANRLRPACHARLYNANQTREFEAPEESLSRETQTQSRHVTRKRRNLRSV
ncbi:hypothetical protein M758_UG030900 [Ceratodon purpureus]|nr:hypothetical protein M758_UG030900 [Ceratodon purpureus]